MRDSLIEGLRSCITDLKAAVYQPAFYAGMKRLVKQEKWRQFTNGAGDFLQFDDFSEFLTHEQSLAVPDLVSFFACLQGIAKSPTASQAKRAQELLVLMAPLTETNPAKLDLAAMAADPEAHVLGDAVHAGPGRGHKTADVISGLQHGTSQTYLLKRLARDQPELLEQIGEGKPFKSVRAAAIEAGIVKDVPTVRLVAPEKVAAQLIARMGDEWAAQLTTHLTDLLTAP